MKHSDQCLEMAKANAIAIEKWYSAKPTACRLCGGWGGRWLSGGGYLEPPDFDECPDCLGNGLCPQCGEEIGDLALDMDEPCPHCGCDLENIEGAPEPYECWGECEPEATNGHL